MTEAFEAALAEVLHHEGGFSNHKSDPGGTTMLGVTKRVWENWTGTAVTEADMRALTPAMVAPLYRANYWNVVRGDDLPPALALCVFDFAVNAGPGRAARMLQKLAGASVDGQIGPATVAAVRGFVARGGERHAVELYQDARRAYYRSLGNFPTFGRGWLRRVDEVERAALEIAT